MNAFEGSVKGMYIDINEIDQQVSYTTQNRTQQKSALVAVGDVGHVQYLAVEQQEDPLGRYLQPHALC